MAPLQNQQAHQLLDEPYRLFIHEGLIQVEAIIFKLYNKSI